MAEAMTFTFRTLVDDGVLEIGDGYRAKLDELGGDGPLFLRAGALTDRGFVWDELDSFRDSTAITSKRGRAGDVVITTKGNSVGRVGRVPSAHPDFVYSPHLSYWRSRDETRISAAYLYYWSRSGDFSAQLGQLAFGTDMAPYLSLRDQLRLRIELPAISRQTAVAELLSAIDDQIAANERVVAKSDELAATLWQKSISSGRLIPLSALAEFVNGRAFTKGASGTGRVVVRIAELNSGIGSSTVYNDIQVSDEHVVRPGDLLFAWSGSLTVARWYRHEAIVNQHIFKVIPRSGFPIWLVNQALRSKLAEFKAIASDKATTMGHIQRRHLDESVVIPHPNEVERVDCLMDGLWRSSLSAEIENEALARTREELLPLLMSGKVRVKEAEVIASEAS